MLTFPIESFYHWMKIYSYQHTHCNILGHWKKREKPISVKGGKVSYERSEVRAISVSLITIVEA